MRPGWLAALILGCAIAATAAFFGRDNPQPKKEGPVVAVKWSAQDVTDLIAGTATGALNGKTIGESFERICAAFSKTPMPMKCGWKAEEVTPGRWTVTAYQRGEDIRGKPTNGDLVWLFDAPSEKVQPRNVLALVQLLDAYKSPGDLEKFKCGSVSCAGYPMHQETDSLPWFQLTRTTPSPEAKPLVGVEAALASRSRKAIARYRKALQIQERLEVLKRGQYSSEDALRKAARQAEALENKRREESLAYQAIAEPLSDDLTKYQAKKGPNALREFLSEQGLLDDLCEMMPAIQESCQSR